jgi:hypothetical protein
LRRLAPTLVSVALLGATAAAFAVAERVKLEALPIRGPDIQRYFSPGCRCAHPDAQLRFRLPNRDVVTITIVDSAGRTVRTLIHNLSLPRGAVLASWNGRDDRHRLVPQGAYFYRVHLQRKGRTVNLPFGVTADTTAPTVRIVSARPPVLLAGRDGHSGRVKIRYRLSERARPLVVFRGRVAVRGHRQRPRGQLDWYARTRGKALPPGVYRIAVVAIDPAGNRSAPATIQVRIHPR